MINNEKLKEIAELVKLYVSEEEAGLLASELNEYLKLFDIISEIKAEDISTMSAVSLDSLREDLRLPSLPSDTITRNAKHKEDGFFAVEVEKHE